MEQEHKQLVIGILAHVDSGKTTLSEALLYGTGTIRKLGRVDHKDAFLDTDALEKARGITIFSKQALFTAGNTDFTLLDTPGHVDFSTETERTLQVLDYAVLVISGTDGVQSHTETSGGAAAVPHPHLCVREQDGPARPGQESASDPAEPSAGGWLCGFWGRAGRPGRGAGSLR